MHGDGWSLTHLDVLTFDTRPVQLENTEHASSLTLLRLFSTGTWNDYTGRCLHALSCCACLRHAARGINAESVNFAAVLHTGNSSSVPPLSPAQQVKLKQLTVVSIAENMKVSFVASI